MLMSFKGQKQGAFTGNSHLKGIHAGKSILLAASYGDSISPRTSITGCYIGKRRHQPVTIMKQVDAASPQLLAAHLSKESLTGKIELVNAGRGSQIPGHTIELTGGYVSSIRRVPPVRKGQTHLEGRDTTEVEEISFSED